MSIAYLAGGAAAIILNAMGLPWYRILIALIVGALIMALREH